MTNFLKESFYKSKLADFSVSQSSDSESDEPEKRKIKALTRTQLSGDMISKSLSNLGKRADSLGYAFLSINISNQGIYSINGLEKQDFLQDVNLSNNNLFSLNSLSGLQQLTQLDASANRISKLLDFTQNQISKIPDLKAHRFLKRLNLNNNQISKISGLENNLNLMELSLNNNLIEEIEGLDNLNLVELQIQANKITIVSGFDNLPKLRTLNVSRNKIKKIKSLSNLKALRNLFLSDNLIRHIRQLKHIESLDYLSVLDLCFNPIQQRKWYRLQVFNKLPNLRILDGIIITAEEQIQSESFYGMDLDQRRDVFLKALPEEDFIDRRIDFAELLDQESQSEEEIEKPKKGGSFQTKTLSDKFPIKSKIEKHHDFKAKTQTDSLSSLNSQLKTPKNFLYY